MAPAGRCTHTHSHRRLISPCDGPCPATARFLAIHLHARRPASHSASRASELRWITRVRRCHARTTHAILQRLLAIWSHRDLPRSMAAGMLSPYLKDSRTCEPISAPARSSVHRVRIRMFFRHARAYRRTWRSLHKFISRYQTRARSLVARARCFDALVHAECMAHNSSHVAGVGQAAQESGKLEQLRVVGAVEPGRDGNAIVDLIAVRVG